MFRPLFVWRHVSIASCATLAYFASMNEEIARLSETLGNALQLKCWQVTAAESCTGGGVSHAITSVPGSSSWFEAGFVTYSNTMKTQLLGVGEDTLARSGAVSTEVAEAMLQGALERSGADIGVAVSGIAGPGGGSRSKPVGTVVFASGSAANFNSSVHYFAGSREQIREQSVVMALRLLIACCEVPCY